MTSDSLCLRHEYEFAPIIVWDALVDPDLIAGWLAEATVTPEVGGEYNLDWQDRTPATSTFGRIVLLQPLARLHVDTNDSGRWEFVLDEVEGGFRGWGTVLTLRVVGVDDVARPHARADWITRLEQLDELLRGHPVDWARWEQDRRSGWLEHLEAESGSTG